MNFCKKIFLVLISVFFSICAFSQRPDEIVLVPQNGTVPAAGQSGNSLGSDYFLVDRANLFSERERTILEEKLRSISNNEYGISVFIETIDDYSKIAGTIESAAESISDAKNAGSGILLLISMADRIYDLDAFGGGQSVFTSRRRSALENKFLPWLSQNQWFNGMNAFAEEAGYIISNYAPDEETRASSEEIQSLLFMALGIAFLISLIFAGIRLSAEKRKLKNVKFATDADRYESANGVLYSIKDDIFKYSSEHVIVHESSNRSGGGGGGGHSHSSGHF